jgi:protein SDA1
LLEDHFQKLREDHTGEEGDEDAWEGWDVESDSSSESGSEGWMDVDSDGEDNLEISDSEDEDRNTSKRRRENPDEHQHKVQEASDENRVSVLATTKVGVPGADFSLPLSLLLF